jgi:hypothetical protein
MTFYSCSSIRLFVAQTIVNSKRDGCHRFWSLFTFLLMCRPMFDLVSLMALIHQLSGTPYIVGGNSPAGMDCSGLVSLVSNVASDRPAFSGRFNTGNEESALLARGFQYGTAPEALVVGWNGHHTAATLPDGTPVSSGEGGGVRIGGGGAYQAQFTHHMFLPMAPGAVEDGPAPDDAPVVLVPANMEEPAPAEEPVPAPDPASAGDSEAMPV